MSLFNDNPFADDEEDVEEPFTLTPGSSPSAPAPPQSSSLVSPPASSPVPPNESATNNRIEQSPANTATSTVEHVPPSHSTPVVPEATIKPEPSVSVSHTIPASVAEPSSSSSSTTTTTTSVPAPAPASLWTATTESAFSKRAREEASTTADVKVDSVAPIKRRVESNAPPTSVTVAPPAALPTAPAASPSGNVENDDDGGGNPFEEYDEGEEEDDYNALVVRNAELESQLESLTSTLASKEQRMQCDRKDLQREADTYKSAAERLERDIVDLKAKHAKELGELHRSISLQNTSSTNESSSSGSTFPSGDSGDNAVALLRLCGAHSESDRTESTSNTEELRALREQIVDLQVKLRQQEANRDESCNAYLRDTVTRALTSAAATAIDPSIQQRDGEGDDFWANRCSSVRHAIRSFRQMIEEQKGNGEALDVDAVTNVLDALCDEFGALSLHAEKAKKAEMHAVKSTQVLRDSAAQLQNSAREFEVIVGQMSLEQQVRSAVVTAERCNVHDETVQRLRDRLHVVESVLEGILERNPQIASPGEVAAHVVQETMNRCKVLESRVNQLVAEVFYLRQLLRERGVVEVVNAESLPDKEGSESTGVVTQADAQQGRLSVLTACCESLMQRCAWLQTYIFDTVLQQSAAVHVSESENAESRGDDHDDSDGGSSDVRRVCSPLISAQLEHACEHMKVQDAYIDALQTVGTRLQREAQFVSAIRLVALSGGNPSEISSEEINLQSFDGDSSAGEESKLDALRHLYNDTVKRLASTLNEHLIRVQQSFERNEKSHLAVVALLLKALDAADGVAASVAGIERVPLKQLGLEFALPFSAAHAASVTTAPRTTDYDEAVRETVGKHQEQLIAEKAAFDKRYNALEKKLAWFTQHKRNEAVVKLSSTLKKVDELTKELEEAKAISNRSSRAVELQLDAANERIAQLEEELNATQRSAVDAMAELDQWRQRDADERARENADDGEEPENTENPEQEGEVAQPEDTLEDTVNPPAVAAETSHEEVEHTGEANLNEVDATPEEQNASDEASIAIANVEKDTEAIANLPEPHAQSNLGGEENQQVHEEEEEGKPTEESSNADAPEAFPMPSEEFRERAQNLINACRALDVNKTGKLPMSLVTKLLERYGDFSAQEMSEFTSEATTDESMYYEEFVNNVIFGDIA